MPGGLSHRVRLTPDSLLPPSLSSSPPPISSEELLGSTVYPLLSPWHHRIYLFPVTPRYGWATR